VDLPLPRVQELPGVIDRVDGGLFVQRLAPELVETPVRVFTPDSAIVASTCSIASAYRSTICWSSTRRTVVS